MRRMVRWSVGLGMLILGGFAGRCVGAVSMGTTGQTLPLVRPLSSAFSTMISVGTTDTVGRVEIGRDDLSVWASVTITFAAPPISGLSANTPYQFVYRPLWDADGFPNRPGQADSQYFQAQWTACDAFARGATSFRGNPTTGVLVFYLNPSATASNKEYLEFFKYRVGW